MSDVSFLGHSATDRGTPRPLQGELAVVTGGSRGIGTMIAQGFLDAGARVVISSRKADACRAAADELGSLGDCRAVPADLSTAAGVRILADAIGDEPLHVLVNNAGATWGDDLETYPPDAFDKVWAVNVKGVFALTQALLGPLRSAARPEHPARVINIGSMNGLRVPTFENFAYSASKAGVHMLTQHLAARLAPDHITVNAIAAGPFPSRMMAHVFDDADASAEIMKDIPLGRAGRPEDIAGLATFLAGPSSTWITGAVIPLDGGCSL